MPDLYLCLDLDGSEEAVAAMSDSSMFDAKTTADVLLAKDVQGPGWRREWAAFPGTPEGKAAAKDYARKNHTLVVIPLDVETVPLDDMP